MPRFAANLAYLFTERPFMERFAAAAAAGFKAVELQFPYEFAPSAVKAELKRHGLVMLGINTPPGRREAGEFGLAAATGREADFALLFRQALDYVVAIGGRQIHCLAGKVPPEGRPAAEKTFIKNLAIAADAAAEHGITVLIEPINPRDRPDIQFDFYHAQIVGGDLIRRFEKFLPVTGHVQIAAVPARHEPDEGEVSYPAIFAALDRLGYGGWIGCEYNPRAKTEDGLAWMRPFGVPAPNH
jgi:hydroxypyruvate isomerase